MIPGGVTRKVATMGDWTFRVNGVAPALSDHEQHEVIAEALRLRDLMGRSTAVPAETRLARITRNPSGPLGEYVSLLMEATARGLTNAQIVPNDIRRRYGDREWFAVSLDVWAAFSDALAGRGRPLTSEQVRRRDRFASPVSVCYDVVRSVVWWIVLRFTPNSARVSRFVPEEAQMSASLKSLTFSRFFNESVRHGENPDRETSASRRR